MREKESPQMIVCDLEDFSLALILIFCAAISLSDDFVAFVHAESGTLVLLSGLSSLRMFRFAPGTSYPPGGKPPLVPSGG